MRRHEKPLHERVRLLESGERQVAAWLFFLTMGFVVVFATDVDAATLKASATRLSPTALQVDVTVDFPVKRPLRARLWTEGSNGLGGAPGIRYRKVTLRPSRRLTASLRGSALEMVPPGYGAALGPYLTTYRPGVTESVTVGLRLHGRERFEPVEVRP